MRHTQYLAAVTITPMPSDRDKASENPYEVPRTGRAAVSGQASEKPLKSPVPFPFGTPRNRWVAVFFAIVVWFATPFAAAIYFATEFGRDAYPPEGDSIIIPIVGGAVLSVAFFPPFGAFLWFAVSRYSPEESLMTWNVERPVWSLVWTTIFLALILNSVHWATSLAASRHLIPAGHTIACIILYAILRAAIVARPKLGGSSQ